MTGFLGSTILEVAIGITFVYLLLATLCSTVNEWIAAGLNARASNLKKAIAGLLNDQKVQDGKDFLQVFYAHPIITGLMKDNEHPAYIPAGLFAGCVMDIATAGVQGSITFTDLENGIKALPEGDVRKALLAVIQNTQGNLVKAQQAIENWFDDAMDRASGWYRRTTQIWTVLIATILTVMVNADTLNVVRHLWVDPTVRAAIVAGANTANANAAGAGQIPQLGELVGWSAQALKTPALGDWIMRIVGWIVTIIAVSIGAPFWFDVLNKFVNLRSTGRSPRDSAS
jgi:hypothetical protein